MKCHILYWWFMNKNRHNYLYLSLGKRDKSKQMHASFSMLTISQCKTMDIFRPPLSYFKHFGSLINDFDPQDVPKNARFFKPIQLMFYDHQDKNKGALKFFETHFTFYPSVHITGFTVVDIYIYTYLTKSG